MSPNALAMRRGHACGGLLIDRPLFYFPQNGFYLPFLMPRCNNMTYPFQKTKRTQRPDGDRRHREYAEYAEDIQWLLRASKLPGKAPISLAVAILVLSLRFARRTYILLTPKLFREFGVDRTTAYRACRELENAGLITVHRCRGRAPMVDILFPADEEQP